MVIMDVNTFNNLLENPTKPKATQWLDKIIEEFPYFQVARAIQLCQYFETDSEKYEKFLPINAAYAIDREMLFEFIMNQTNLEENLLGENSSDDTEEHSIILTSQEEEPSQNPEIVVKSEKDSIKTEESNQKDKEDQGAKNETLKELIEIQE